EVVVNGGASSGAFAVTTSAVSATTTVTITATWFSVTRTATVTVTSGAPAPADRVAITNATWDAGLLTIEATSTDPNANPVRLLVVGRLHVHLDQPGRRALFRPARLGHQPRGHHGA